MQTLNDLNRGFSIPDQLSFSERNGLIIADIHNAQASASLCLQGAYLMTWTPHGQKPVLWLSPEAKFAPGKSIRGGVPICWPWFGPHATDATFPGHGFARTVPWELIGARAMKDGSTWLALRLLPSEAARTQWPHASETVLQIVIGATLDMDLGTLNTGDTAFEIGDALHTYFAISDIDVVTVQGLDGTPYIDKVGGSTPKQQAGPISIYQEVDRIYVPSAAECVIHDIGWDRRIHIEKLNSHSTIVWNPWIEKANKLGDLGPEGYRKMLCVESANAASDVVTVAPQQEHHLWVRYSVEVID